MTAQRIKGQEVAINIVVGTELQSTLTDIQNFGSSELYEIISKGYLGEKTERKDQIFKGVKFDMELHLHSQDFIDFRQAVNDKATRVSPDTVFNISAVMNFPDGTTPEVLFSDCSFGEIPMRVNSRGDYVSFKLQGECSDIDYEKST